MTEVRTDTLTLTTRRYSERMSEMQTLHVEASSPSEELTWEIRVWGDGHPEQTIRTDDLFETIDCCYSLWLLDREGFSVRPAPEKTDD